jgi:hypothetical protein
MALASTIPDILRPKELFNHPVLKILPDAVDVFLKHGVSPRGKDDGLRALLVQCPAERAFRWLRDRILQVGDNVYITSPAPGHITTVTLGPGGRPEAEP